MPLRHRGRHQPEKEKKAGSKPPAARGQAAPKSDLSLATPLAWQTGQGQAAPESDLSLALTGRPETKRGIEPKERTFLRALVFVLPHVLRTMEIGMQRIPPF